jgi:hypothetical protein
MVLISIVLYLKEALRMYPLRKANFVLALRALLRAVRFCKPISFSLKKLLTMAFGICRVRNLKMGDVASTDQHNARLFGPGEKCPPNIDPAKPFAARYLIEDNDDFSYPEQTSLQEAIDIRMEKNNVKGVRKNSRVALEYILSVNDQVAWENYSPSAFFSKATDWIEDRHGKGSVVAMAEHYDETNPHVHIVVVPLIKKEVRYKNRYGSGTRTEVRLNTAEFTDGREKLRQLQTDYYEFCKPFEQKMGVEFYRGTLVENQTREYVEKTDHTIGRVARLIERFEREFPHLLQKVKDSIKKRLKTLKSHLFELKIDSKANSAVLEQEIKRKRDASKNNQWKNRGQKDSLSIDPAKPPMKRAPSHKTHPPKAKKDKGRGGMGM